MRDEDKFSRYFNSIPIRNIWDKKVNLYFVIQPIFSEAFLTNWREPFNFQLEFPVSRTNGTQDPYIFHRIIQEKLMKCQAEKEDLEQRCKRLMQSTASAAQVSYSAKSLLLV